jgi:hypothetical protein
MDTYKYNCAYCHEEFIPKRRYAQKYCSNSCRAKAYHRRQVEKGGTVNNNDLVPQPVQQDETTAKKKMAIDKMSASGVGNAMVGTLLANLLKNLLSDDGSKPATKSDIAALIDKLQRFHLITNLQAKPFGRQPYFDMYTNQVVYF